MQRNFSRLAPTRNLGPDFIIMDFLRRRIGSYWLRLLQVSLCTGWLSQGCGGNAIDESGQGGAGNINAATGGSANATGGTASVAGGATSPTTGGASLAATGGTGSGPCYSPTQNLSIAYKAGSKGCACTSGTVADVCVQGVALICENNHWIAVEDGPCMPQYNAGGSGATGGSTTVMTTASGGTFKGGSSSGTCFTPRANVRPGTPGGCPCAAGSASVCIGGTGFICSGGYWIAVYDGPCMPGTGGTKNVGGSSNRGGGMAGSSTGGVNVGSSASGDTSSAGAATVAKQCGARAGDTCNASEYCAYRAGQYCGQADAQATCQPRPQGCVALYSPVCGCDGRTYGNSCEAASSGTGVYGTGECTH